MAVVGVSSSRSIDTDRKMHRKFTMLRVFFVRDDSKSV